MFKNYNTNQVILPLDFTLVIPENDIARLIDSFIESIPDSEFEAFKHDRGASSFHPRMMLKIILCAYTQSVTSGRKIDELMKDSIRMMWLAQGHEPSYRTIKSVQSRSPGVAPDSDLFCSTAFTLGRNESNNRRSYFY